MWASQNWQTLGLFGQSCIQNKAGVISSPQSGQGFGWWTSCWCFSFSAIGIGSLHSLHLKKFLSQWILWSCIEADGICFPLIRIYQLSHSSVASIIIVPLRFEMSDELQHTYNMKVFVGNIPSGVSEESLKQKFQRFGECQFNHYVSNM